MEHRSQRPPPVHVVVAVEMSRRLPHELVERFRLAPQLIVRRGDVVEVDDRSVALVGHVDVQTDGQPRVVAGERGGRLAGATVHHQAGAGDDPGTVSLDDSSVYAVAKAEIVDVDDAIATLVDAASTGVVYECGSRHHWLPMSS